MSMVDISTDDFAPAAIEAQRRRLRSYGSRKSASNGRQPEHGARARNIDRSVCHQYLGCHQDG